MQQRRHTKQILSLEIRLAEEATRLREEAKLLKPGALASEHRRQFGRRYRRVAIPFFETGISEIAGENANPNCARLNRRRQRQQESRRQRQFEYDLHCPQASTNAAQHVGQPDGVGSLLILGPGLSPGGARSGT